MDGEPRGPLAAVGGERILPRMHPPAPVPHEGQGHLRHGQRRVRRPRARLRGRHPLGAPGAPPERCGPKPRLTDSHRQLSRSSSVRSTHGTPGKKSFHGI